MVIFAICQRFKVRGRTLLFIVNYLLGLPVEIKCSMEKGDGVERRAALK